ncbi:hypothetical protein EVAR_38442_1 [Eumeta japonica]|uniref:Uncharacterized protein n=1 Tax=Eumeta variegata TaxID=151549 RepID=A0A4C1X0L7_EUMVA|nr:hypothetical protein EVAR_38442_1 [Eumeta japonica]
MSPTIVLACGNAYTASRHRRTASYFLVIIKKSSISLVSISGLAGIKFGLGDQDLCSALNFLRRQRNIRCVGAPSCSLRRPRRPRRPSRRRVGVSGKWKRGHLHSGTRVERTGKLLSHQWLDQYAISASRAGRRGPCARTARGRAARPSYATCDVFA